MCLCVLLSQQHTSKSAVWCTDEPIYYFTWYRLKMHQIDWNLLRKELFLWWHRYSKKLETKFFYQQSFLIRLLWPSNEHACLTVSYSESITATDSTTTVLPLRSVSGGFHGQNAKRCHACLKLTRRKKWFQFFVIWGLATRCHCSTTDEGELWGGIRDIIHIYLSRSNRSALSHWWNGKP